MLSKDRMDLMVKVMNDVFNMTDEKVIETLRPSSHMYGYQVAITKTIIVDMIAPNAEAAKAKVLELSDSDIADVGNESPDGPEYCVYLNGVHVL